ncbi:uncharacterized protein CIMG_13458 [Coccidioides immitis RS]|uniref:Uncharacterized protein n=1 Tax=Coccidioides immitis (strain RS) TaxID=246410 RepID=J3KFC3_COCIM|nr:uncharacterized protein CIMG_13458 [Coccidioides immitis RS]EAS34312.3 hypothetical protein CIMG_13458 [Coccidioides immitis RS]
MGFKCKIGTTLPYAKKQLSLATCWVWRRRIVNQPVHKEMMALPTGPESENSIMLLGACKVNPTKRQGRQAVIASISHFHKLHNCQIIPIPCQLVQLIFSSLLICIEEQGEEGYTEPNRGYSLENGVKLVSAWRAPAPDKRYGKPTTYTNQITAWRPPGLDRDGHSFWGITAWRGMSGTAGSDIIYAPPSAVKA